MSSYPKRTTSRRKKPSDRGRLVKKHWEHKSADEYRHVLGKKERGRGIYVLYQKGKVYYIGLSRSSLRGRIRRHAKHDRHKKKWDTFSFYQIGRTRYIKDVEALLLRIVSPPGNWIKGRFVKKHNLARKK
jgi:GIY-YIG catalytic domain